MNSQGSLFVPDPEDPPKSLDIEIVREAISFDRATEYFLSLQAEVEWKQERIKMFGRETDIPRLTAWHGDPGGSYTYSGIALTPSPWTAVLEELREIVESRAACRFNSVLLNLYRDGNDSVAWHADDEPDLGREPVIGSLSLGASRRFDFRKKMHHAERFSIALNSGDLVIMRGLTQQLWEHQIPKNSKFQESRINLTFRQIRSR